MPSKKQNKYNSGLPSTKIKTLENEIDKKSNYNSIFVQLKFAIKISENFGRFLMEC